MLLTPRWLAMADAEAASALGIDAAAWEFGGNAWLALPGYLNYPNEMFARMRSSALSPVPTPGVGGSLGVRCPPLVMPHRRPRLRRR